jgi:hypothetical protein
MHSIDRDLDAASTGELVRAAAEIAAELAHRPPPVEPGECFELAETLAAATDLNEAALAGFIDRVDATGEMKRWGLSSTRAWLRTRMGMREARAGERLALARQRHRLPRVAGLLAAGELSFGYAATVAGAVTRLTMRTARRPRRSCWTWPRMAYRRAGSRRSGTGSPT